MGKGHRRIYVIGEGFPYTIISYKNAGECLEREDRLDEAVECYKSAAECFRRAGMKDDAVNLEVKVKEIK